MTTLLNNPPDLPAWRRRLFEVIEPITLSPDEFDTYWPYVDNVWVRRQSRDYPTYRIEYWNCRLQRTWVTKPPPEDQNSTLSQLSRRKQSKRQCGTCDMRLSVQHVTPDTPNAHVIIQRLANAGLSHSHDLPDSDMTKRNSVLLSTARTEASKGYSPAIITAAIRLTGRARDARLEEAGGRYLTRTDVENAGPLTGRLILMCGLLITGPTGSVR